MLSVASAVTSTSAPARKSEPFVGEMILTTRWPGVKGVTVSVAGRLFAVPIGLLTVTAYCPAALV